MTQDFNISELARLAKAVLDANNSGQEFMLEDVYNVTRAAYERYPEDAVIRKVASAIEIMAGKAKGGETISQKEISAIYNHCVDISGTSRFRDVLGHLLLKDKPTNDSQNASYVKMNRDVDADPIKMSDLVDPEAVKQLTAVFGGDVSEMKAYDTKVAAKGAEFVAAELKAIGKEFSDIKVVDGDHNIIVYATNFDTPNGCVTVPVPIEVQNGIPLFPSKFLAGNSLKDLTLDNINEYVDGQKKEADFSVITKEPDPIVDTPAVKVPKELEHIAKDFEEGLLESASIFGRSAIDMGKETVARELYAAGFKGAQVKFGSESGDSAIYLATIGTPKGRVTIEVPVEMHQREDGRFSPLSPTYFGYDGLIEDFSAPKLQRFALRVPQPSSFHVECSNAFSYMTLPEIKDEIMKAAANNDYVTCEEGLAKIQETFTEEDFKNAIADYHNLLMHKIHLDKYEQTKCQRLIPAGKGSIYARCGCTGLPLDKVATDEYGNCIPKSTLKSQKLNPVKEAGAVISTSKIELT